MKRTTASKEQRLPAHADFIFTADWHLRDSTPVCRKDDYYETQFKKVAFIVQLSNTYQCPILIAGDIFDTWKPSIELITRTYRELASAYKVIAVYGNHDLPMHSLSLHEKCGLYMLSLTGVVEIAEGGHWGTEPSYIEVCGFNIAPLHKMTYIEKPYPGSTDVKAHILLKRYKHIDCLVTGDNHQPFVLRQDDRLLVNPGSLTRMDADQINHRPRVYLYNARTNSVTEAHIPIDSTAVSNEHLQSKEERDTRIDAFIEHIQTDIEIGLSFEENLRIFVNKNNTPNLVKSIIYKSLE